MEHDRGREARGSCQLALLCTCATVSEGAMGACFCCHHNCASSCCSTALPKSGGEVLHLQLPTHCCTGQVQKALHRTAMGRVSKRHAEASRRCCCSAAHLAPAGRLRLLLLHSTLAAAQQ